MTIVLDLARSAATTVVGTLPTAEQAAGAHSSSPRKAQSSRSSPRDSSPPPSGVPSRPLRIPTSPPTNWWASGCSSLQPDRSLRAHLPEREAVHMAVPPGQRAGLGRHGPLPPPQDRRRVLPVRLVGEDHPDARAWSSSTGGSSSRTGNCSATSPAIRGALHDPDLLAGHAAERHHVPRPRVLAVGGATPAAGLDSTAVMRETACHEPWVRYLRHLPFCTVAT